MTPFINEFDPEQLELRCSFFEKRAQAHLRAKTQLRWHRLASATLLRDAAAVALIAGDLTRGEANLQSSGRHFIESGLVGGFQLLLIAGTLNSSASEEQYGLYRFSRAFAAQFSSQPLGVEAQLDSPDVLDFDKESFEPSHLLRAYQGLAGRMSKYDTQRSAVLRSEMRRVLELNPLIPVGSGGLPLQSYLAVFDWLAARTNGTKAQAASLRKSFNAMVQRRAELLTAARRDAYHWASLSRPAELVDFDFLALLVAGLTRGRKSRTIAASFATRDDVTALPFTLAKALKTSRDS